MALIRWLLFFGLALGLGYPTLNRYDPRVAGNPDAAEYHRLVVTWPPPVSERGRYRLLVPYVAKPFYRLAAGRTGTWEPALLGLLVANALFCASTASIVVSLGLRVLGDPAVAMLGATLLLLNFAVPNLFLAGLVDSGEGFALAALAWALLGDRPWLLLGLGPLGTLAKETFLPLAVVFGLAWHLADRARTDRPDRLGAVLAMALTGTATLVLVPSLVAGALSGPWHLGDLGRSRVSLLAGLVRCVADRGFWYVFAWLLPLGLPRVLRFPRPWLAASGATSAVALLLGAWIDSQGNIARPIFSVAGPLLSLSAAWLVAKPSRA
jgi:hypothetical protein